MLLRSGRVVGGPERAPVVSDKTYPEWAPAVSVKTYPEWAPAVSDKTCVHTLQTLVKWMHDTLLVLVLLISAYAVLVLLISAYAVMVVFVEDSGRSCPRIDSHIAIDRSESHYVAWVQSNKIWSDGVADRRPSVIDRKTWTDPACWKSQSTRDVERLRSELAWSGNSQIGESIQDVAQVPVITKSGDSEHGHTILGYYRVYYDEIYLMCDKASHDRKLIHTYIHEMMHAIDYRFLAQKLPNYESERFALYRSVNETTDAWVRMTNAWSCGSVCAYILKPAELAPMAVELYLGIDLSDDYTAGLHRYNLPSSLRQELTDFVEKYYGPVLDAVEMLQFGDRPVYVC
jgi:hypothetical protein